MNAQLNSTNFQQFVASNKGKKITFKHNDTEISKVVVDVCGDYFTCKNQESDAKIDGFYYFSECQLVNDSLIDVLQKHKVVVIKPFHVEYMFRYSHTSNNIIYGVDLNTTNNLSFLKSIKEVWAIVDGKYTQVWKEENKEEQPTLPKVQPSVPNKADKEKKRFEAFKGMAKEWIIFCEKVDTDVSDKFGKVIERMMVEEYSPELYNKFCSSYESVRNEATRNMRRFNYLPQTQAISKRLAELTNACKKVCDDEPIDDLVEKINKMMSVEGKNTYSALFGGVVNQINIEYRGKPKTVEIINEYTLANGKQYIMVKDITDHDKTKTLFKEYVKYM